MDPNKHLQFFTSTPLSLNVQRFKCIVNKLKPIVHKLITLNPLSY